MDQLHVRLFRGDLKRALQELGVPCVVSRLKATSLLGYFVFGKRSLVTIVPAGCYSVFQDACKIQFSEDDYRTT